PRKVLDVVDPVELRRDPFDAELLDLGLVHAGAVEVAELLLVRAGLRGLVRRELLEDPPKGVLIVLAQLFEGAPPRAVRRNRILLEPSSVGVLVEVGTGLRRGVHVRRRKGLHGGRRRIARRRAPDRDQRSRGDGSEDPTMRFHDSRPPVAVTIPPNSASYDLFWHSFFPSERGIRRQKFPFLLPVLAAAGLPAANLRAQEEHQHAHGENASLGKVHFPTSCSPAVADELTRAVALLHSFGYEDSRRAFESVAQKDPGCAMAYWGIAMT